MKQMFRRLASLMLALSLLAGTALAASVSIKLGSKYYFLYEGESAALKTRLRGVSADELEWESADEDAVLVSDGVVTGRSAGRAMVRASAGGKSAKCGVVVLPRKWRWSWARACACPAERSKDIKAAIKLWRPSAKRA